MITNLEIKGMRALKHVNVPLKPLTVLIGANDTGKSTFLDAVAEVIADQTSLTWSDGFHKTAAHTINITAFVDDGVGISLQVSNVEANKRWATPQRADYSKAIVKISPCAKFRLTTGYVQMTCNGYELSETGQLRLGDAGERTAALLDYILRTDRTRFELLVGNLRNLVPGLADVEIGTPDRGTRQVVFVTKQGLRLIDKEISEGARICTFFVALAWHPFPPKTILIEEPENGIHPKRLAEVMGLLRGLTHGALGSHRSQVILTTHSPYLLDQVNPEEDQVLIFQRHKDGYCTATPPDMEKVRAYRNEDIMLGEVWTNENESGLADKEHQ